MKGVDILNVDTISVAVLDKKKPVDVITDLREGRYSLLESLGFHKMRKEMKKIGFACRYILSKAERRAKRRKGNYEKNLRIEITKILNNGAPSEIVGKFPKYDSGLILGFNHPTLGEIIRIIAVCETAYPGRRYLFPVNIAWYEELAPAADRLEALGVYITPTITPATRGKMEKALKGKSERSITRRMAIVDKLSNGFNAHYLTKCSEFVDSNNVVLIAPSATRQATVFRSAAEYRNEAKVEPQTMTYIALGLTRTKSLGKCYFLPVAVIPPRRHSRRLNLYKKYQFLPAKEIDPIIVRNLVKSREFEHYFLGEIARTLINVGKNEYVFP